MTFWSSSPSMRLSKILPVPHFSKVMPPLLLILASDPISRHLWSVALNAMAESVISDAERGVFTAAGIGELQTGEAGWTGCIDEQSVPEIGFVGDAAHDDGILGRTFDLDLN